MSHRTRSFLSLLAGVAAALALAAFGSDRASAAPCADYETPSTRGAILAPAAGGRSDTPVIAVVKVPPDLYSERKDLALQVIDATGTAQQTYRLPDLQKDTGGSNLYGVALAPMPDPPAVYTLRLTEFWDGIFGACETTDERPVVLGAPILDPGFVALQVRPFLENTGVLNQRVRVIRDYVFAHMGIRARPLFRITVKCEVIDDGYGNRLTRRTTISYQLPGKGEPLQRDVACGDPSSKPVGASETDSITVRSRRDLVVRAHRNGRLRYPWRVTATLPGLPGSGVSRRGYLEERHAGYSPASSSLIYDTNFDDYVNICINGNKQIRASGGHLYCRNDGPEVSIATLRYSGR